MPTKPADRATPASPLARSIPGSLWLGAALLVASALSVGLYALRVFYTGERTFFFLNWNLFLAWLPALFAAAAWLLQADANRPRLRVLPLLALWLLFFPNAPYLLTDLIHLRERLPVPIWFDLFMLLSYAWSGLILGYLSLRLVQGLLQRWFGPAAGWAGAAAALLLGAFGIYLGRFERWNSWDLFTSPRLMLQWFLDGLANPALGIKPVLITLLLCGLLGAIYLSLGLLVRGDPLAALHPAPQRRDRS